MDTKIRFEKEAKGNLEMDYKFTTLRNVTVANPQTRQGYTQNNWVRRPLPKPLTLWADQNVGTPFKTWPFN